MEGFGAALRRVSDYVVDFPLKHILLSSSKLHIPTKKPAGYKSPMKSVIYILIRNVMIPEIHQLVPIPVESHSWIVKQNDWLVPGT